MSNPTSPGAGSDAPPPTGTLTPRGWRSRESAAVAGIAFALLMGTALALLRLAAPADPSSGGEWLADPTRRRMTGVALNLVPFAGIAFLWFVGVIRDRLGDREDKLFATVFYGSGLLFIALVFVAAALGASLLEIASDQPAGDTSWMLGRTTSVELVTVYAMRMAAVFILAVTRTARATGLLPRWLVLFGFVCALVLMLTLGRNQWVELVFPLWVLLVSVTLLFRRDRRSPGTASPGASEGGGRV